MSSTQRPSNQTQHGWLFDPLLLKAGDVVLERSDGKESDLIARVDGGAFSHALLWVGGTDFIEAIDGGARTISFARVGVDDPSKWALLRFVGAGAMSPHVAAQAAAEARNLVFKPYNLKGAVASITPFSKASATDLFCSELVAEAYRRAGGTVSDRHAPEQTTPRVLQRSEKFREIRPLPLKPGKAPPGERGAAYADTPMNSENQLAQVAYAELMELFGDRLAAEARRLGLKVGNLAELINLLALAKPSIAREASDKVFSILESGGYYGFIDEATKADVLSRAANAPPEVLAGWNYALDRHRLNLRSCKAVLASRPWPFWQAQVRLYADLTTFFQQLVDTRNLS